MPGKDATYIIVKFWESFWGIPTLTINLTLKYVIQNAWIDFNLISPTIFTARQIVKKKFYLKREYQENYARKLDITKNILEAPFMVFATENFVILSYYFTT